MLRLATRKNLATLEKLATRFGRDERGAYAVVFAVTSTLLMGVCAFGVNTAQVFNAHSALSNALDAAVTSTARDLTTGRIPLKDARKNVEAFLKSNLDHGFADASIVSLDTLSVDKTTKTVSATASLDVALAFPMPGMSKAKHVETETVAAYSDRKIEVSMMLDVTGSMSGDKIKDLKKAAKNAVDTFLKSNIDSEDPRVRVALVPYANSVNAGALASKSVFVETKATGRIVPPTGASLLKLVSLTPRPDNCATERKGDYALTDVGPATAMVSRDLFLTDFANANGTATCPSAAVMPLTDDGKALKARIDTFAASGTTGGHMGVQWAWYMLSPKWNALFDKTAQAGVIGPKTGKYVILMTDGEFNLEYSKADKIADVFGGTAVARSMAHAGKLCTNMKKSGIEVFTIGFKLDNAEARKTMADCASPDLQNIQHFFQAATGVQLDEAFQKIAANIERLAVTK